MSISGPNIVGTGANNTGVGTNVWNSPSNITASDNTESLSTGAGTSEISNYLFGTNPGFSIPSTDQIDGIEVTIHRRANRPFSTDGAYDEYVQLIKGGTVVGSNKAATGTQWPVAEAPVTYGGPTDKWGTTWTYSDINSSSFGAALAVDFIVNNLDEITVTARVDTIEITIYHSIAGGSGPAEVQTAVGTAKASIKTKNGIAIANIKAVNGVS